MEQKVSREKYQNRSKKKAKMIKYMKLWHQFRVQIFFSILQDLVIFIFFSGQNYVKKIYDFVRVLFELSAYSKDAHLVEKIHEGDENLDLWKVLLKEEFPELVTFHKLREVF